MAAIAAPTMTSLWGRRAFWVLALAPASGLAYVLAQTQTIFDGRVVVESISYLPLLGLDLDFRLDSLSWFLSLFVSGIGALVLIYCSRYFSAKASGLGRFSGVLTAFAGAMFGLIWADNLILLYVFWELTTVFSYLLIGHYASRKASRRAAMQAIIVTTAGGLTMLFGFVALGAASGSYRISAIVASPPSMSPLVTAAVVCLLVGAISKAALIPFHFWLPAAMAAPTPVSAYLHAAAMVKAGVYLVARFAPGFSDQAVWRWIVLLSGGATLIVGGYRALRQFDLKLVLAYGTVSQLGLMVMLVGAGSKALALAGIAMVGAHAMFKAALFLSVGAIDVASGTRDLRRLSGVGKRLPVLATATGIAVGSMMGVPPLTGFIAKESAVNGILHGGVSGGSGGMASSDALTLVVFVLGSVLTTAYGLRFWWGAFASKPGIDSTPLKPTATLLRLPTLILAATTVIGGFMSGMLESAIGPYADSYPLGPEGHIELWSGWTPALGISLSILALGALAFWARGPIEKLQDSVVLGVELDRGYRRFMRGLDRTAGIVTGWVQRGSLPVYLGTILLVTTAFTGFILLTQNHLPDSVRLWDSPYQLGIGVLMTLAAVLAARSRRRLKAVVLVGVTGYGTALLFLMYGAPDLALTQALVETVSLVVFVLVLRRLPGYYSNRPLRRSRWFRIAAAAAFGLVIAGVALVVPGARIHEPISASLPEEALAFGYGTNIVNVMLVDVRAWDTMGEISVLLVAATGVASLVFVYRRGGQILRVQKRQKPLPNVWAGEIETELARIRPTSPSAFANPSFAQRIAAARGGKRRPSTWLRGISTLAPSRRSVLFEVSTRLLFHSMIVFAIFLLFSGHNNPGGGFSAGLVVGLALMVRYLAGGRYELGEAAPVQPGWLLGAGLFLSAGVGLVTMLAGSKVLQSYKLDFSFPLIGDVHLTTSLFFDIGVFLVVIGLILDILRSLGAEVDRQGEVAHTVAPEISHDSPQQANDEEVSR